MTERHEHRVAHTELTLVSFECKSGQKRPLVGTTKCAPKWWKCQGKLICALCEAGFDSALYEALGSFKELLSRLTRAGQVITFRIPYSDSNEALPIVQRQKVKVLYYRGRALTHILREQLQVKLGSIS